MKRWAVIWFVALAACSHKTTPMLGKPEIMDPETCKTCHPDHYREWARSMHAYASDDPVFAAMVKRGVRETSGMLGDFCVKCHAPLAAALGLTQNGTDLDKVPKSMRGVTCYFCHSIDSITGDHNGAVHLADDDVMRGSFADVAAGTPHRSAASNLHDRNKIAESSKLCGSCHDIVTPMGAAIERTYQEWQKSLFGPSGMQPLACGECHMHGDMGQVIAKPPPDLGIMVKARFRHEHDFPAVDSALTDFPEQDMLRAEIKTKLDLETLPAALCLETPPNPRIYVLLDNFGPGHSWPSGAVQDRRAWVEVKAYKGSRIIYSSGVVPDGTAVESIAASDPDLWLIRDCMFDASGQPVDMFWQAASFTSNQIHWPVTNVATQPGYFLTHVDNRFANSSSTGQPGLPVNPDRVTAKVRFQPIGVSVLDELVKSGDLDPSIPAKMPTYDLASTTLVWTSTSAQPGITTTGTQITCVANFALGTRPAICGDPQTVSHARCVKN